jgi:hypothetical protein
MNKIIIVLFLFLSVLKVNGQNASIDSTKNSENIQFKSLIIPSVLIGYGVFGLTSPTLKDINNCVKNESPTYIIAFTGVSIWFMNLNRPVAGLEIGLLIFAVIISSSSFSGLFPKAIKMYILPYRLKVLPCLLIWLKIILETLTRKFGTEETNINAEPITTKMSLPR